VLTTRNFTDIIPGYLDFAFQSVGADVVYFRRARLRRGPASKPRPLELSKEQFEALCCVLKEIPTLQAWDTSAMDMEQLAVRRARGRKGAKR
jgi:hypothetical protein